MTSWAKMAPAMGVEGGRDARRRPTGDQGARPLAAKAEHLADCRAERRAYLHDRSFAAGRAAGADCQRGSQHFQGRHAWPDAPTLENERLHHFGHAVPLGFWSPVGNHVTHHKAGKPHGQQKSHYATQNALQLLCQIADAAQQPDKSNRARPCTQAHNRRCAQQGQLFRRTPSKFIAHTTAFAHNSRKPSTQTITHRCSPYLSV